MKHKYTVFCGMYRYMSDYRLPVSPYRLERDLLETRLSNNFAVRQIIRTSIAQNYDVTNGDTCRQVVAEYAGSRFFFGPVMAVLMAVYLEKGSAMAHADSAEIAEKYFSESALTERFAVFNKEGGATLSSDEQKECITEIRAYLTETFSAENRQNLEGLSHFLDTFFDLVPLAQPFGFMGFDYARVVEIITKANNTGILSDAETRELLNHYGGYAEQTFGRWENFLASCILGKQFMMFDGTVKSFFIKGAEEYINDIYGMTAAPSRPWLVSGIWPQSNLADFARLLENYINPQTEAKALAQAEERRAAHVAYLQKYGADEELEQQSLRLFDEYVMTPAIETQTGLETYFDPEQNERRLFFAYYDVDAPFWFWDRVFNFCKKHKISLSQGEVPVVCSTRCVITNKMLYVAKKSLFSSSCERVSWPDARFSADIDPSGFLKFSINGIKIGEAFLDVSRGTVAKVSDLYALSTQEANTHFKTDLAAFNHLFENARKAVGAKK